MNLRKQIIILLGIVDLFVSCDLLFSLLCLCFILTRNQSSCWDRTRGSSNKSSFESRFRLLGYSATP